MKQTNYSRCKEVVAGLEIGESKIIEMPEKLQLFRRNLFDISRAQGKKFTTKVVDGKLLIMRIRYVNIISE